MRDRLRLRTKCLICNNNMFIPSTEQLPAGISNGGPRREWWTKVCFSFLSLTDWLYDVYCLTRHASSPIPSEFERLEALEVLRLGCNHLTGEPRCH